MSFALFYDFLILTNERANIIRGSLAVIIFFIFLPQFKTKTKNYFLFIVIRYFFINNFLIEPIKIRFVNEISSMSKKN